MGKYVDRGEEFLAMVPLVEEILGKEKAAIWWGVSNPMFGGVTPTFMVASGRGDKVWKFIIDRGLFKELPP
jgi:hypothetical protein